MWFWMILSTCVNWLLLLLLLLLYFAFNLHALCMHCTHTHIPKISCLCALCLNNARLEKRDHSIVTFASELRLICNRTKAMLSCWPNMLTISVYYRISSCISVYTSIDFNMHWILNIEWLFDAQTMFKMYHISITKICWMKQNLPETTKIAPPLLRVSNCCE